VYLGVLAILSTPDVTDLRYRPGTWTSKPNNCGTQVRALETSGPTLISVQTDMEIMAPKAAALPYAG
jgi:hypothetical protein